MRSADTYRAARRNLRGPGDHWHGIRPGRYPRKPHNAAKLQKPVPAAIVIPELLLELMARTGMRTPWGAFV